MAGLEAGGNAIQIETPQGLIAGVCDPRFTDVLEAFRENFAHRQELGASCAVTVEGRPVVDLWGGAARPAQAGRAAEPWTRDTLAVVFSCTKGATAFAAHWLAERGLLELDAKVTDYWPEFGAEGKGETRVSMCLDHTAGVPALRAPVPQGGALDFEAMAARVAAETPFFEPGTVLAYHGQTFAWTIGMLIRRAGERTLGRLFGEELAKPLGLDFWIGTPADILPRVATLKPTPIDARAPKSRHMNAVLNVPGSIPHLFSTNMGGLTYNKPETLAAEIGSSNGVSNARGLAGLYAPLALGGANFVGAEIFARMKRVSAASHSDQTLLLPMRFSLGFMRATTARELAPPDDAEAIGIGEEAFGHAGRGGSIGFADPECRMSFGYVMNRMSTQVLLDPRGQSLIDATYRALGYRSRESGAWRQ